MKEKRDDRLAYKGKTIRNGYVQRSDPAENADVCTFGVSGGRILHQSDD